MARQFVSLAAIGLLCTAVARPGRELLGDEGASPPTLQARLAAVAVDNTVILTQTSCGYIEFSVNWILHVERLGITNWLTIAEDEDSLTYINSRFPGHAVSASEFTRQALASGSGLYEYGTEAFTRLACARPVYLQTVLDAGFSVVWSDTDTVWLQNLLDLAPRGLDYVGVDDSELPEQDTDNACTGLMYLNPTDTASRLLREWHQVCQEQNYNNQPAWNQVFSQNARKSIAYYIMPRRTYPHGMLTSQVYSGDPQMAGLGISADTFNPAWIHANFRVGRVAKRAFLKERDAWAVSHDQGLPTCSVVAGPAHRAA